jgi:uncharacterized protein (TIGR02145 family)
MKTKLFFKMYSRTAMRLCYCCCLLLLFAACSKENYPQESDAPAHAASDKTWVIESADGSIKQTWSDAIQIPECNKADFDGGVWDAPKADCRSYTYEGSTYYYYSWPYVDAFADRLCPSPWRVPAVNDVADLVTACGGAAFDRSGELYTTYNHPDAWGGQCGGQVGYNYTTNPTQSGYYWSRSTARPGHAWAAVNIAPYLMILHKEKTLGLQVRCVK